jgi:ribosomal protein L40E
MASAQFMLRLIDQNGAASPVHTQAFWNQLFVDVQHLYDWQGTNPFYDGGAIDHWELSQAAVTHLYKAVERYRWHTAVLMNVRYRQSVDTIFVFLRDAVGIVWIDVTAILCSRCDAEVPIEAVYCIHCGEALGSLKIPQPRKAPPQIGKTRRLG